MTGLEAYKSLVESSDKLVNVGYKYKRNKDYDELIFRDLKILEFIRHHIESVTNECSLYSNIATVTFSFEVDKFPEVAEFIKNAHDYSLHKGCSI